MKGSAARSSPPKRKYFPAGEKLLSHNRRSPQAEEEDCVKLSEPAIRHPSLCLPTQDNIWRSQLGRLVEAAAAVDRQGGEGPTLAARRLATLQGHRPSCPRAELASFEEQLVSKQTEGFIL